MSKVGQRLLEHRDILMKGKILSIDPSIGSQSSMPGYAVFMDGALVTSGLIPVDRKKSTEDRLQQLSRWIASLGRTYDLMLIENVQFGLRRNSSLLLAAGALMGAASAPVVIQVPPAFWRPRAGTGYIKGDERDAIEIGRVCIACATTG